VDARAVCVDGRDRAPGLSAAAAAETAETADRN
jgi:hypothetical protein